MRSVDEAKHPVCALPYPCEQAASDSPCRDLRRMVLVSVFECFLLQPGLILGDAVRFPDPSGQLLALASNRVEIVVGQLAGSVR